MSNDFDTLLNDINRKKLRVKSPTKFVFFCGGFIHPIDKTQISLRGYLWHVHKIGEQQVSYILAEDAQNLFLRSGYSDLITFEEDIARIASIVLVTSESAGSLCEIGAFCANEVISPVLKILISEKHYNEDSFVRLGPIERLENASTREAIGVYPWKTNEKGHIIYDEAEPHVKAISDFVAEHVSKSSETRAYPTEIETAIFFDILWIVSIANVISPEPLNNLVKKIHPDISSDKIRRKIYSMMVAKWVSKVNYGGKDYYYLVKPQDPYLYAFKDGVKDKEPTRRTFPIREDWLKPIPEEVRNRVSKARGSGQ